LGEWKPLPKNEIISKDGYSLLDNLDSTETTYRLFFGSTISIIQNFALQATSCN
jgi:hypothetical protein